MKQYLDLVSNVLQNGSLRTDRTGVGTTSLFGPQIEFDLRQGFPAMTTKKLQFSSVVQELQFFVSGETNTKSLGCRIWDPWSDKNGNLGPIYPHQWRKFGGKYDNIPQPEPILRHPLTNGVLGVGSQEGYISGESSTMDRLLVIWRGILQRCYREENDNYEWYGGKGVYVCNEWLEFMQFAKDAVTLPGFPDDIRNFHDLQLDKDILGDGFEYSPRSCCWVSKSENSRAKSYGFYVVQHDDGRIESFMSPCDFYTRNKVSQGNFCSMLRGQRKKSGGWSLLYSSRDGVDQLSEAIATIKSNPDSRRIVVSAWNPQDIYRMSLPPCHILFQFYVGFAGDKPCYLDCKMYQRSADCFLGVPFNISQYALLTHVVAGITKLIPRRLIITFGDLHIYNNHFDQVMKQIARKPMAPPQLKMPDFATIEDFVNCPYQQITLEGYQHHPAIKGDIAV